MSICLGILNVSVVGNKAFYLIQKKIIFLCLTNIEIEKIVLFWRDTTKYGAKNQFDTTSI
jgi:hypothetical protein